MFSNSKELLAHAMRALGLREDQEIPQDKIEQFKALVWKLKREDEKRKEEKVRQPVSITKLLDFVVDTQPTESPIEDRLYAVMCVRSMLLGEFQTQFEVGPYRLDFAFPKVKLYVEADGKQHYDDPGQVAHDRRRGEYLASLGWTALRFPGRDINRDPHGCAEQVQKLYSKLLKRSGIPEPWEK